MDIQPTVQFDEGNVKIILSAFQYIGVEYMEQHIKIFKYMDVDSQQRADAYEAMRRYVNSEV